MTLITGTSLRIAALMKLALLVAVYVLCGDVSVAANRFSVADVPNVHLADAAQYVSDPSGQITPQDTASINAHAAAMEREMSVQVAVVVLKNVGDNDAREFATDIFNTWGVGKKGKDNGLLVLLVTEPPQRSVIFETGYGLEGVLPDAITFRLQQRYMVPFFQRGEWGPGLINGIDATRKYLAAGADERATMTAVGEQRQQEDISPLSVILMIGGFFLLLFIFRRNPAALALLLSSIFSGRGGRGGGFGGGGSWGGGSSGGGGSMGRF